jgi:SAM-dependent methyltransferase
MSDKKEKPYSESENGELTYLDIQAEVGMSKHFGGFPATDRLHKLCHLEDAQEVLEVGCGVGVGPAYIAKRYGCKVVAVDISEKMLSWAEKRARQEGVLDKITFQQADVSELPFETDRFDAALVESVLSFVNDKKSAVEELLRVLKPGGYLGVNESFWKQETPVEVIENPVYGDIPIASESVWREIWREAEMDDRSIITFGLQARQELQDRIQWMGWRAMFAVWGRSIRLMFTNPLARESIKQQADHPKDIQHHFGYGLFVGRKPTNDKSN